jgi:hypothetical protein
MGEQIKRYQTSFSADDDVVLASDHDREIAQRDGRIVELDAQLAAARELVVDVHNSREVIRAERDTAREMLLDARKWMQHGTACNINQYGQRLADKSLVCSCGLDDFLASLKE